MTRNCIFNTGSSGANLVNSGGQIRSDGFNLSNDSAGGDSAPDPGGLLNATGDMRNTDPRLGPLAVNGGATPTHMPLRDSPALDRGKGFGIATDQRGRPRPANAAHRPDAPGGDGADIGAIELNPFGNSTDEDGDGMADEWESFHDVDAPAADPDNDGDSNVAEHAARTDPRDPAHFTLRILSIASVGSDIVIIFNGVAGQTLGKTRTLTRSACSAPLREAQNPSDPSVQ